MCIIDRCIRVITFGIITRYEITVFILIKDTELKACGKHIGKCFVYPFFCRISLTYCLEQIFKKISAIYIAAVRHGKSYGLYR